MQNKEAIVMKTKRNTTAMLKTFLCLPITALLLTAALAGPASAEEGVPFKGVIEGTEDFTFQVGDPSGIDLLIDGSGVGNATHLGAFSATWHGDITFGPALQQPIERTFVAANGDELYAVGHGAGTPPDDDPNFNQYIVEELFIIGGTGRFEGATGSFTVERTVFNVLPPFTGLETVGTFDGTIILAH